MKKLPFIKPKTTETVMAPLTKILRELDAVASAQTKAAMSKTDMIVKLKADVDAALAESTKAGKAKAALASLIGE